MQTEIITIDGMGCDACSKTIERALNKLNGVTSAAVVLETKKATVIYDPDLIDLCAIKEAITEEGYDIAGSC